MSFIGAVDFTLEMDSVLTQKILKSMKDNGFSRVPIVEKGEKNRIIGILIAMSCLSVDPNEKKTI